MRCLICHDESGNIKYTVFIGDSVHGRLGLVSDQAELFTEVDIPELDNIDMTDVNSIPALTNLKLNYRVDVGALKSSIVRVNPEPTAYER